MKTSRLILFFKSHIDTFTRKNGSVVQAHEDKRSKRDDRTTDMFSGKSGKEEAIAKKPVIGREKSETLREAYGKRVASGGDAEREFRKIFNDLGDVQTDGGDITSRLKGAREFLTSAHVTDEQRSKWSEMLDDVEAKKS